MNQIASTWARRACSLIVALWIFSPIRASSQLRYGWAPTVPAYTASRTQLDVHANDLSGEAGSNFGKAREMIGHPELLDDFRAAIRGLPSSVRTDLSTVFLGSMAYSPPDGWSADSAFTADALDARYEDLLWRYDIDVLQLKAEFARVVNGFVNDGTAIWTPEFWEAVKEFQRRHGLDVDGIPGPLTRARLRQISRTDWDGGGATQRSA